MSDLKAALYKALVDAQREARALFRDGKNKHHDYKYVSAEQIIDEARKALGSASLALFQRKSHLVAEETRINVGKSQELVGRLFVDYRLVHDSGENEDYEISLPVIISSGRPDDKAEAAAMTMCLGYFLRGLLLIPRDDGAAEADQREAEIDQRDDRDFVPDRSTVHEPPPRRERASEPPPANNDDDGCPTRDIDAAVVAMARELVRRGGTVTIPEIGDIAAEAKRQKFPEALERWVIAELRAEYTRARAA